MQTKTDVSKKFIKSIFFIIYVYCIPFVVILQRVN